MTEEKKVIYRYVEDILFSRLRIAQFICLLCPKMGTPASSKIPQASYCAPILLPTNHSFPRYVMKELINPLIWRELEKK